MASRRERALRAQAAISAVLAEDEGALWPDDIKALNSALSVVQQLARSGARGGGY